MPHRAFASLTYALVLTLSVGCGGDSSTNPTALLDADLTGTATSNVNDQHGFEQDLVLECDLEMDLTVRGSGTGSWAGSSIDVFFGTDRSTPSERLTITSQEIAALWGAASISPGEFHGGWSFTAEGPFSAVFHLRWQSGGGTGSTSLPFVCGPEVPEGGGAAPLVNDVVLTGGEQLEPNESFTVSYSASGELGLWSTRIILSGAWTDTIEFAEFYAASTDREVTLTVPVGSPLGESVDVRVEAQDIAFQSGSGPTLSTDPLADLTAPIPTLWLGGFMKDCNGGIDCQFSAADSLLVWVQAADNSGLGWLVWEITNPVPLRDSVSLRRDGESGPKMIFLSSDAAGASSLIFFVTDVHGNVSEPHDFDVRIYPVVPRPVESILVSGELRDAAFDPRSGLLFLSTVGSQEIRVLRVPELTEAETMDFSEEVSGLDLTVSGDSLVVALPERHSVAVFDLLDPSDPGAFHVVTSVSEEEGFPLGTVEVLGDGRWMVSMSKEVGATRIIEIDPRTGDEVIRFSDDGNRALLIGFDRMLRSPDRTGLLAFDGTSCAFTFRPGDDEFSPCIPFHDDPQTISGIDVSGTIFTNWRSAFDPGFQRIAELRRPHGAGATGVTPDGSVAYISTARGLDVIRLSDLIVEHRVEAPPLGSRGRIVFSPDGSLMVGMAPVVDDFNRVQESRVVSVSNPPR